MFNERRAFAAAFHAGFNSSASQAAERRAGEGEKRALRVESPQLQCSTQPLGEASEVTPQLRVSLLAGRLQGTRHFHSAPIEIGQK